MPSLRAVLPSLLLASLSLSQERAPIPPNSPGGIPVSGRVLRADGTPVRDARVVLHANLSSHLFELPFGQTAFEPPTLSLESQGTTTDAQGVFRLDAVDPEHRFLLEVDAGAAGVQSKAFDPDDRAPDATFPGDWELSAVRTLSGILVDADTGSPVPNAEIRLSAEILASSSVDPERLVCGEALLYLTEDGASVWVPPPWLVGLLRDGAALEEHELRSSTRTRADGSFELPTLANHFGDTVLEIAAPGRPRRTMEIDTPSEDERADVGRVRMPAEIAAHVRILDARGAPVPGAEVRIGIGREPAAGTSVRDRYESFPVSLAAASSADADGRLEAAIPRDGVAWIAARAPGGGDWTTARVTSPTGPVEITLPDAKSIDVRLVDPEGRSLDGEVVCTLVPAMGPCSSLEQFLPVFAPDLLLPGAIRTGSGSARLAGLRGGSHYLLARAPGHALANGRVVPVFPLEPITVRLEPLRTRSIRVLGLVDGATRPLAGARVSWESIPPRSREILPEQGKGTTDAQGGFRLSAAGVSDLRIRVEHADFAARTVKLDASETDATVRLGEGGTLAGRIHRSGKPPASTLSLALVRDDDNRVDLGTKATVGPPDFTFRLRGLPPGTYQLEVGAASFPARLDPAVDWPPHARRTVVVEDGKTRSRHRPRRPLRDGRCGRRAGRRSRRRRRHASPDRGLARRSGRRARKERYRHRTIDRDGDFDFGPVPPGRTR
jgi:protocatechuate 3,4-dioxygenase beta subunit